MLLEALSGAAPSVTKEQLERYMKYKRDMERQLGMDKSSQQSVEELEPTLYGERRPRGGAPAAAAAAPAAPAPAAPASAAPAPAAPAAARTFDDDHEMDDIYDDE